MRFEPSGGLPIASEIQVELDPAKVIQEGQVFTGETKITVKTDKFLVEDVTASEEPAQAGIYCAGPIRPPHRRGRRSMIFHVTLEQAEDCWIVAECPALPGCVSQGMDEKEALENIREAIVAWLWAEDQKAMAALPKHAGNPPIVVAV